LTSAVESDSTFQMQKHFSNWEVIMCSSKNRNFTVVKLAPIAMIVTALFGAAAADGADRRDTTSVPAPLFKPGVEVVDDPGDFNFVPIPGVAMELRPVLDGPSLRTIPLSEGLSAADKADAGRIVYYPYPVICLVPNA